MNDLNNVPSTGTFGNSINLVNQNFGLVKGAIENVEGRTIRSKGLFPTQAALTAAYPSPKVGDYAYVGSSLPATVYDCLVEGTWHNTGQTGGSETIDLGAYSTTAQMNTAIDNGLQGQVGYAECNTDGSTQRKDVVVNGFKLLASGGALHIKMTKANTHANATMNISPTSTIVAANTKPLFYNGAQASSENTWAKDEIISVYYDGTNYQATNSQGGGGNAEKIKYENSQSGLAAENVQEALDEINEDLLTTKETLGFTPYIDGQSIDLSDRQLYPSYSIFPLDASWQTGNSAVSIFVPIGNAKCFYVTANSSYNSSIALVTRIYVSGDSAPAYASGETGRRIVTAGGAGLIDNIPSDAMYACIGLRTKTNSLTYPDAMSVYLTKSILNRVKTLEETPHISEVMSWEDVNDDEYLQVDVDSEDKIHHAILRDGRHYFPAGIMADNIGNYEPRPPLGYENFVYNVDIVKDITDSTSLDNIVSITPQQDRGIICLPNNYSAGGAPVRLVLMQMGTTYTITNSTTTPVRTMPDPQLLLAEGYAVMQINGTPNDLSGTNYGSVGNPEFIQCFKAAYNYVVKKYNIRKDGIFVAGYSQGSLTSLQVAYLTGITVIAALSYGPAQSFLMMYSHVDSAMRQSLYSKFSFCEKVANDKVVELFPSLAATIIEEPTSFSSIDNVPNDGEKAYLLNNIEKWIGYDMMFAGTSNIVVDAMRNLAKNSVNVPAENDVYRNAVKNIPCPLKVWVTETDTTTPLKYGLWLQSMITNGGQLCSLRKIVSGGHAYPDISTTMYVSTTYGGTVTTKAISYEGLLFMKEFDF